MDPTGTIPVWAITANATARALRSCAVLRRSPTRTWPRTPATGGPWRQCSGTWLFFDRLLILRWDTYEKDCVFAELTPNHFDLINYAGADDWSALPPRIAVARCIEAAEHAVARIDALPEKIVSVVLETPRVALLERMLHWNPHLDQIQTAIGREI